MSPIYFPNAALSHLKVYDMATIQQTFNVIAHDSGIEFNFPQGGCQQRAQIMSMLLDKRFGIDHYKIWLFPPSALNIGDSRALYIPDKNKLTPGNIIEWNYHVAPVIQVQDGEEVHTMVIDPSINPEEPLLLSQWFAAMGNSDISKYSFLTPDKYFFYCCYTSNNLLTPVFDGTFFNYENPVKDNLAMEKGLAVNDMAIRIFHKYLQPLMASADEAGKSRLADLKDIFGNTTALDMLFAQNLSGYTPNTTHRYVLTYYRDIVNEARAIFNERLTYWTEITNTLL